MNKEIQNRRILKVLETGRGLTRFEAMEQLHIANFTARISELRQDGYNIVDKWEVSESGARYKRYFLNENKELTRMLAELKYYTEKGGGEV